MTVSPTAARTAIGGRTTGSRSPLPRQSRPPVRGGMHAAGCESAASNVPTTLECQVYCKIRSGDSVAASGSGANGCGHRRAVPQEDAATPAAWTGTAREG